jgi:hypothetical protein
LFPNQPGLVFWKGGLAHIKQAHVPINPSNPAFSASNLSAKVYSTPARDFIFHYMFFGHAMALKALDQNGSEIPGPSGGFLASTVSGRGDLLGRDLVVTIGNWSTRTKVNEAGTGLHELGHNLGLYHGGTAGGANCITTHVSSINYLYQNAGVFRADGTATVDFSREALTAPLGTENSLDDFDGLGSGPNMPYRLRWYAPRINVAALLKVNTTSLKLPRAHCDSSLLASTPIQGNPSELVRVDGFGVARTKIDWNYDGSTTANSTNQDLDFDGNLEVSDFAQHYAGVNDWQLIISNQGLRQVNVGRSLFGLSLGVTAGDLVRSGEIDLTQLGDLELGDLELGDLELGDLELGDLELGDLELGDLELGDLELGAAGLGDLELGASDEIDEPTSKDIGMNLLPSNLTANAVKLQGNLSVSLSWTAPPPPRDPQAPGAVTVTGYLIYRSNGSTVAPPLTQFTSSGTGTTFSDPTVSNNTTYTYFVIAVFSDGSLSGPSNSVPVLAK